MCQAQSILSARESHCKKTLASSAQCNLHFAKYSCIGVGSYFPNQHLNAQSEARVYPIFTCISYFWGLTFCFQAFSFLLWFPNVRDYMIVPAMSVHASRMQTPRQMEFRIREAIEEDAWDKKGTEKPGRPLPQCSITPVKERQGKIIGQEEPQIICTYGWQVQPAPGELRYKDSHTRWKQPSPIPHPQPLARSFPWAEWPLI